MTRRIDPSLIPAIPDLSFERALWKEGLFFIAGIDEAGRGCLAGPVTAAAVIITSDGWPVGFFFWDQRILNSFLEGQGKGSKRLLKRTVQPGQ